MPRMEASHLRRFWRFRHALNKQKVTNEAKPTKKMLIYNDRSRYMYESKGKDDNMPEEMSDIYVDMTWILQKSAGYDVQFAVNCVFGTGLVRKFAV